MESNHEYHVMPNDTPTRELLRFIIEKEPDLDKFDTLVEPLTEKFKITKKGGNRQCPKALINTIVHWENHPEIFESLEVILNNNYEIEIKG